MNSKNKVIWDQRMGKVLRVQGKHETDLWTIVNMNF